MWSAGTIGGDGAAAIGRLPQRKARALAWTKPGSATLLLLILAGLAAFRLAALAVNGTDLYVDEAQYWSWSRELSAGYYSKPPLIAWLIAGVTPLCGDGELCVRLPSVVLHLATSLVIYLIGVRLYSAQAGFWAAVTFATLPGISVSSGIISTDVPLLLAWAIALLAFAELAVVPSVTMAILLGCALGLGLNAKYAMAYFIPCAAIYLVASGKQWAGAPWRHLVLSAVVAALIIAPNILWNASHGFATFAHTADNANWSGSLFHPGKAAEFLLSQLGVFGPILFGALLVIWTRAGRFLLSGNGARLSDPDRLLIAFSLPIVAALTVQGLLSRSLANWAAPAYVAGSLLVVSVMIRDGAWTWLRRSLALHAVIAITVAVATAHAGRFIIPGGDPFARTLGSSTLAADILSGIAANETRGVHAGSVLSDDREVIAALLYYGRDANIPVHAWRHGAAPRNHFELSRPFGRGAAEPVLLVSRRRDGGGIPERFGKALALGPLAVPAGDFTERTYHLFELMDFKGAAP